MSIDRDIKKRKRHEVKLQKANDELEIQVKERTIELENALKIIKQREKELKLRKLRLEKLAQKRMDTNQALSILARNIDKEKKMLEKRILIKTQTQIMPIFKRLQKEKSYQRIQADLILLGEYIKGIIP